MILTQSQIEIENSLRRILPADIVSLWIPDGYNRAKDIIRGNHGTAFGTHPNVPVISVPYTINACDAKTGWEASAGGVLDVDADDKKEGTGSLKNIIASPVDSTYYTVTYNLAGSWDWSAKKHLLFWLKCNRVSTAFKDVFLYIQDTSLNWRYWDLTFSAGEWTAFELLLSTGDTESTEPIDLALITDIQLRFRAKDTTPSFHYNIDDIRIAYKPSLINPSVGWRFGGNGVANDYVRVPDAESLRFGTGDFHIGAWINSGVDITTHRGIYAKGTGSGANTLAFYVSGITGILRFLTGGAGILNSTTVLNDNVWHYAEVIRSGDSLSFYVDSVLDATTAAGMAGIDLSTTDDVTIGWRGGAYYFIGNIALLSASRGAWSEAQSKNFYNATKGLFAPRG